MTLVLPPIAVAIAALAAASCGGTPPPAAAETAAPLAAPVAAVVEAPWGRAIEAAGSVAPARRASPGTILAGRVTRIEKREGDRVRAGETLALIESGGARAGAAQADAAVAAARVAADNAHRMRERMERLVGHQAASQKNLEDAIAGDEGAKASLTAAEEGARAAHVQLDYARVAAPFDGIVVRRLVEAGDMAGPGMPLYVIDEVGRMKLETSVPETVAAGLHRGDAVSVSVDGDPQGMRQATLDEILPASDPATRTVTVRVILDNADGSLRPGAYAHVSFPGGAGAAAIAVPEGAVVRRGPLAGVFVVDPGGVARLRWLTFGETRDGLVEVLTGLSAGERIVTAPPRELEDGRRVEVSR